MQCYLWWQREYASILYVCIHTYTYLDINGQIKSESRRADQISYHECLIRCASTSGIRPDPNKCIVSPLKKVSTINLIIALQDWIVNVFYLPIGKTITRQHEHRRDNETRPDPDGDGLSSNLLLRWAGDQNSDGNGIHPNHHRRTNNILRIWRSKSSSPNCFHRARQVGTDG